MSAPYWEATLVPTGVEPPRSWVAVDDTDAGALSLDGRWDFRYGRRADGSDLGDFVPDAITVPGHWQLQGHGQPQYTNVRYPFALNSPHVPEDNPTGEYRRSFAVPAGWDGGRVLLRFDGVDSCARITLNGHELGVSTGSRLPVEFDVTDLLSDGGQELVVRVHQWSAGTYVEDQDMWWLSGIFRSVTLLHRPADSIRDFWLNADFEPATGLGTVTAEVDAPAAVLSFPELGLEAELTAGTASSIDCGPVEPWSAERPRLYTGVLRTAGESITVRLGFRRVRVEQGQITVNGNPVLFRGVNRHEWDARTGRAVSAAVMATDVELMKANNFNAVRTAHYPPHPHFLGLCDAAGLYVIDECDLETHGYLIDEFTSTPENPVLQPEWVEPLRQRMQRMVERDKNHPSIILWSPGNESGAGPAVDAMLEWVGRRDPSRLRIYEGDKSSRHVDVYSLMYTPHEKVRALGEYREEPHADAAADEHRRTLPFVLVEYVHAMGLGPGGLSEYDELFATYPRLQGGFVWEWIDMCIDPGDGRWLYGGDFGEELHDGNFVADGLLLPDRTPSPALADVKAVFSPIRVDLANVKDGSIGVHNRHEVLDLAEFTIAWRAELDGECVFQVQEQLPPLPAGESMELAVPAGVLAAVAPGPAIASVHVRILSGAGLEVTRNAAIVARPADHALAADGALATAGSALLSGAELERGLESLWGVHSLSPRLWRAPIDNDRSFSWQPRDDFWRKAGLDQLTHRHENGPEGITIHSTPPGLEWSLVTRIAGTPLPATGGATGGLELDITQDFTGEPPEHLPQIGLDVALVDDYCQLDWLGLGPGEGYPDTGQGNTFGRHQAGLQQLTTPYVYPQENGARAGVEWARMSSAQGRAVELRASRPVSLALRPWSTEELAQATHGFELEVGTDRHLSLILASSGVGTASCGPGILDHYALGAVKQQVRLQLSPGRQDVTA
ncbi:glycoside hydrolase family 2 TIM barrel-domain containing protein [Specibacter sp. NPDC057265]|uniref:glycoside hydrolase family 2 TIM barrel-domain containing protein n=1 Tax=Specibacter sp. NPDC057265 TaxID=3346075 RepID=UPI00363FB006